MDNCWNIIGQLSQDVNPISAHLVLMCWTNWEDAALVGNRKSVFLSVPD
mgnify:CR=1 FL=1